MLQGIVYILLFAVSIAFPLFCIKYFKKLKVSDRHGVRNGVLAYIIFGALLNSVVQVTAEMLVPADSSLILNGFVSALFSGAVTAVCTFAGLYIFIKYAMKKTHSKADGLVLGAGYSFAFSIVTYTLSAAVSAVFSFMNYAESKKAVPAFFETTAKIVATGSAYTAFLTLVQCAVVLSFNIAAAAILFAALKKLCRKGFAFLSVILIFACHTALELPLKIEVRLLIAAVITLITAGICSSLCFDKKEHIN